MKKLLEILKLKQAQLEEEERFSRQKEEEVNIDLIESWDNTQPVMDADFQLAQQMQTEELKSDNSKKQRIDEHVETIGDDDQEEAEMKKHMKIVQDDEVAIDAIPLATKPPVIVEWKIIKEGKMPNEAYERVLWGDLKVMFKPDVESEIWRNLQGYNVTVWKLFSSSGVPFVRF
ncbi:hypothetical protein Tco_1528521 [Tanacetum coccineum]